MFNGIVLVWFLHNVKIDKVYDFSSKLYYFE